MSTANQNLAVRRYEKQFKDLLQGVYGVQSVFSPFFGGKIEALDGVANNKTAFSVKTSDIPVVVGTYNTDAATAFKAGTGKSTRFGERTEIIYQDTDVEYSWGWNFHEGIDIATVNNNIDSALADRLELQAQAKVEEFNAHQGLFISGYAGETTTLSALTEAAVIKLFNELAKKFVDNKIKKSLVKRAYVNPDVYNIIVDSSLTTTGKNSATNIDENVVLKFKGFIIEEIPSDYFQTDEVAYATVDGIGVAFTGINTARTVNSEDFDGIALQGHGKAGEFGLDDNKKAVIKVTLGSGK